MLITVVALRSRRLEALLGAPVDDLRTEHIHGLVSSGIQEDFDLDFKETLYGRGDSDRRALAGDVAAMANTAGGLIVLGLREDDQARATHAPGVEITDGEIGRIRQVVASLTAPMPHFDVIHVPDQTLGDGHGFLILAVPRSTMAPHAVLVNDSLRYPRRNGATTRYLTEAEVATAYRQRLTGMTDQGERLPELERIVMDRMDLGAPWVLVSLVPDLPGEYLINTENFEAFRQSTQMQPATFVPTMTDYYRASVGQRCFLADDPARHGDKAAKVVLRVQTDGAGSYGRRLHHIGNREGPREGESLLVWDELLVISVVSGLLQLGQHARDRAATGGNAVVRAAFVGGTDAAPVEIGQTIRYGFAESCSANAAVLPIITSTISVPLDDIATPGPGLVTAADALAGEVAQQFGIIHLGQLTPAGSIHRRYWGEPMWHRAVLDWALEHGIEVIK